TRSETPNSRSSWLRHESSLRIAVRRMFASCGRELRPRDPVEAPRLADTLERALAGIDEDKTRAGGQILHRARDQHLGRAGERADAGADHHADPTDLAVDRLDLAGVHPRPDLQVERLQGLPDRLRAAHRARRAVERGAEAVGRGGALGPPAAAEHRADHGVMPFERVLPRPVAELARAVRRPDDVG